MARCNCQGNTCGCSVTGGTGITVSGIGTASAPFLVTLNDASISIGSRLTLDDSLTVELSSVGTGTPSDPLVLTADVVLRSPDDTRWTLAVGNDGTLSAVRL